MFIDYGKKFDEVFVKDEDGIFFIFSQIINCKKIKELIS